MADQNSNQLNIDSDASGFSVIKNSTKRLSAFDYLEEEIEVKPSSELIPDEYVRMTNETSVVHLFYTDWAYDEDNADNIYQTLIKCGYKIPKENVHNLFETNLSVLLKNISENIKEEDEGLLFFFSALYKKDDTLITTEEGKKVHYNFQKIWSYFTSNNCPNLRNKPKIFIFQMSKEIDKVQHDALLRSNSFKYYDTPAEADILIIFNKTQDHDEEYRRKFVDDLCGAIKIYGKSEDLLTLVTCTSQEEPKRPLIISTLTKKFFIDISEERGHRLSLSEDIKSLKENVDGIHSKLDAINISSTNGKKKKNAWETILKKTSSFRNALSPKRERPQSLDLDNDKKKNEKGRQTELRSVSDHAQAKPSSSRKMSDARTNEGVQRKTSTSSKGVTIPVTKPKNLEPPKPSPKGTNSKRPKIGRAHV